MPSSTAEDYLKVILMRSTDATSLVSMGDIAEGVDVVPGTATTMIKSLARKGLIEHLPRQGVRLTPEGRKVALDVLRKHRLVETFLVSVLKMDWSEVHAEAERLEHALSARVLDRIDALLGHPKTDPHGDPIPNAQGTIDEKVYLTLGSCVVKKPLRLVRIADQSTGFLQFAETEGLRPGVELAVTSRPEGTGAVTLRMRDGREVTLGLSVADKIWVESTGR